jgi:tetratricopeptide (TPR) repeat protein
VATMLPSMVRASLVIIALAPALALAQAAPLRDAARQAAAAEGPAGTPSKPDLAKLLAEIDATWDRRDGRGQLGQHRARLAEAERLAPDDYGVLWREARIYFWLADDPAIPGEEKSRLGKKGWEYGDRATQANPARVEGWHYAAAGVGSYALGIGVITALRQGIEGKFRERLSKAEQIDPSFQNGAIQTAWGRFWYELPWPKYDARKSQASLEAALQKNPDNVRAYVYLADLLAKESRPAEAIVVLQKALAKAPGRYDAPEERRWQEVARRSMAALRKREVRGSEGG